jgi:capsular polysaccharide export protein
VQDGRAGPRPRLILPPEAPAIAARLLSLAGWEPMRSPGREGDLRAVWNAPPRAAGEVGLEPLSFGHPDRIAGLRVDPGTERRFGPSLARLLDEEPLDDTALLDRARDAIARMRHWGLTTAATAPAPPADVPAPGHVLVLDQAAGAAPRADLLEALFLARDEHPGQRILVLAPPGGGQIRDDDLVAPAARVAGAPPLHDLLDGAIAVYAVSAPLGFDAILAGHRPVVLGQPYYAGRGLTDDRGPVTRHRRPLTRAQMFAATMILAPLWYDPHRDALAAIETAISAEAALARAAREDRAGHVAAGMRRWKRRHMTRMLGGDVRFAGTAENGAALARRLGRPLVLWGSAEAPAGADVLRAEDGFLRSTGLGARLVPPLSLALDDLGIYYDPRRESRLERLIAATPALPPAELRRAEALISRIRAEGLTKYNIGGDPGVDVPETAILVPGQVESDASILWGAGSVRTNLGLLAAVRTANPGAVLLYKPHPDVEAGLRPGRVPDAAVRAHADAIVTGDPARLLRPGVSVWTITSLMGFEALLRGIPVTTLGAPFYAGWGLTHDLGPVPARRTVRPGLAGLVHAALIGYPRYFDPKSGLPCPPEIAVERLAAGEGWPAGGLLAALQSLRGRLRRG